MRAAMFEAFGEPLRLVDLPAPPCPADGALVRVRACGVCRSDHHAWMGGDPGIAPPHVPGHEFAGEIVEVGPEVRRFRVSDRVTAPFILGCGACAECHSGQAPLCADQFVLGFSAHGAFAEYVAAPRADFNLVALPEAIGPVEAASLGCRTTTAFRGLIERGGLTAGERLAVHGAGGVGLACVMIAAAVGAQVIAIDVNPAALALAVTLGADHAIDARGIEDVGEAVREITHGGAELAVDAVGITATFHSALRSLAPGGRMVQIGMPTGAHARPTLPLLELIYSRQLSLIGARGFAAVGFPDLFRMIEAGRLRPEALVSDTIDLGEAGAALEAMTDFRSVGVTVIDRFDGSGRRSRPLAGSEERERRSEEGTER